MGRKRLLLTALMILSAAGAALAQNRVRVSGRVTDTEGAALPGATVMLQGSTATGTNTDIEGRYTLTVPADGVLVASMVGYAEQTVRVNGRSAIDFRLPEDSEFLENAVVVGYGSAKKVGSLVGSVSTVTSDKVRNSPSSSALDQLQGQVAGLAVLTTGGVSGDNNVTMTLHGVGSLGSGSSPLFLIDGVPASERSIMSLNPSDILSVSVLKDASATSIYGSRAANGVVYVTTRTGAYNSKSSVTIRSQYGVSTLTDKTIYRNMMSGPELKDFWLRSGLMSPSDFQKTYTDNGYTADTKWYNYFQQYNTPQFQNDVSIEGGGPKVAYMAGASQFHQTGTTLGNYYDRYTVRSNIQGRPKDWLKFSLSASVSYEEDQRNGYWGYSGDTSNNLYGGLSFTLNPLYPAVNPEGEEYDYIPGLGMYSPKYLNEIRSAYTDRYALIGNAYVEIEPVRNLKIASRAGIDSYVSQYFYTWSPAFSGGAENGSRRRTDVMQYSAVLTNTAEYSFRIHPDHEFTVLAGHEGIANRYDRFHAESEGIQDERLVNLQNGVQNTFDLYEGTTESRFLSFFTHVDYSYKDRYLFDASLRFDASSRFGKDSRWASFWSVGGLWKAKQEDFLKNIDWLNDLNLKVSYGTQGNADIGDYNSLSLISSASSNYATHPSLAVSQPGNSTLTWEKQALLTVALTGRVFSRLDFDIEYYLRKTTSMLMSVPYPYTTGFNYLYDNVGGLKNTGIDLTLGVDILRAKDYSLKFSTTFSYNKEKITDLFNGRDRWQIANTGVAYVVGRPVMYYSPLYAGVDPADGQNRWYIPGEDIDEVTKGETTKVWDENALEQNTGLKRNAPVNGGFGFSGRWRGLSFVMDFSYVLGKYLLNNDKYFYENPAYFFGSNASKAVSDFWTPEHPDARYPDWSSGATMRFDDHIIENASFLRLKKLQIGYSLPKRWLNGSKDLVQEARITFTGRNLLTFTKYTGFDPEVDSNLTLGVPGNTKQFLGGIEIIF